jgi:hypothetical protein
VSKTEYQFVKLGISLEDLQDLILTRFDFMKNISQPASQPAVKGQVRQIQNWG